MDGWVIARFIGGRGIESTWQDPVFGRSLVFYFFELPFYTQLIGFLEVCAAAGAVVYYVTARVWQMQAAIPRAVGLRTAQLGRPAPPGPPGNRNLQSAAGVVPGRAGRLLLAGPL